MSRNGTNSQNPLVQLAALIFVFVVSLQACGSGGGEGGVGPQGPVKSGTFKEAWESSEPKAYKPGTVLTLLSGDEGNWLLDATVDGDDDCGATPHRAEIIADGGSKRLKLLANNSRSSCADNVWLAWDPSVSGSSKQVRITPNTHISFKMSGVLYGSPNTTGWIKDNCGLGLPCGTYLAVLDNRGNGVFYRLQWPLNAKEDNGPTYMKILLANQFNGAYARNLYDDFSQVPNFSPSDAYVTGINFEIMPWDHNESELGWAMIDDITIDNNAVVLASLTDLDRVPIFNANKTNGRSVTVSLFPSPLPDGDFVTLDLSTTIGAGSATFDNGTTTMQIRETMTLTVGGVANSSVKDNIKLTVGWRDTRLAEDSFSVRTWPTNIIDPPIIEPPLPNPLADVFYLKYSVESESGNPNDLIGIEMGERVFYPSVDNYYSVPSPPYAGVLSTDNPHVGQGIIGGTNKNDYKIDPILPVVILRDAHGVPFGCPPYSANCVHFVTDRKYVEHEFTARQFYWFKDSLLNIEQILLGPLNINRRVFLDTDGIWKYEITKDGVANSLVEPLP